MKLEILKNHSLQAYNTFGIDAKAESFVKVQNEAQLDAALEHLNDMPWVLGGGSNVLLTSDVVVPVVSNEIGGIEVIAESEDYVDIRIGGGVVWHDLVMWAVERGLGGIENLALIPGKVGAAPIQNIGAYGVELKDVFRRLEAVNLESREKLEFEHADCAFGYRDSVFKRHLRGRICITRIILRLTRINHNLNTKYGAIADTLQANGVENPTIRDVADAVIAIRSSKLPDPAQLGNAGSFFKNPVVDRSVVDTIRTTHPDVVSYPAGERLKVPAGWLIERCGWKGKRVGNVGCYAKQALVIVNHGGATGQEIFDFAMQVRESVRKEFGIDLEPEVNVV